MPIDPVTLIFIALIFGLLFLMSSRNRKMQREAQAFRESLVPGQQVMTGSGLLGTVVSVDDDVVTLETSPGVTTRWIRAAVAKRVDPPAPGPEDDDEDQDEPTGAPADGTTGMQVPDDASSLTRDEDDDRR